MGARVLIVEDDDEIGRGLCAVVDAQGWASQWSASGRAAMDAVERSVFDLALLDLGLPDVDGIDVCRRIRVARPALTIVILTARTDEAEVVAGLDAGADDYLTKPFRVAELIARVRAHLRRPAGTRAMPGETLTVAGMVLDTARRQVLVDGTEIELRAKEFDLLHLLTRNCGRVLTREMIMFSVWGEHWYGSTKTLDMHVSAIRRKLGANPPVVITTLRGVGYRLDPP